MHDNKGEVFNRNIDIDNTVEGFMSSACMNMVHKSEDGYMICYIQVLQKKLKGGFT